MSVPKNEVVYDKNFLKDVRRLTADLQDKLSQLIEILQKDPFDAPLHTKSLTAPLQGMFSFRITRDYRVIFKFLGRNIIQLLAIDKRDKIYKRIRRKI